VPFHMAVSRLNHYWSVSDPIYFDKLPSTLSPTNQG
jgi:hypothetical protein